MLALVFKCKAPPGVIIYRHGKRRDLRDPGSRKYLRIAEEFTIYAENVSISSLNELVNDKISILEMQNFIFWLIRTRIVAIGQYFGPFLPQTIAEICYDQRSCRGNKTTFYMSVCRFLNWEEILRNCVILNWVKLWKIGAYFSYL